MTYKEVYSVISSIRNGAGTIPCAYRMFPADDPSNPPPQPPFLVYYYEGSDDLMADNTNYQTIRPLTVELYTDNKDFALEKAVEDTLTANDMPFTRNESYIKSERMYMVSFETEVIITEESN